MLVKSGVNMFDSLLDFFSESDNVQIYSAYIKYDALRELIGSNLDKIESVCVRWEPKDLIQGSSDIEIYPFLKRHNIPLYINRRIHLKAYIDNYHYCYVGSNNISERALAKDGASLVYNYEVGCFVAELSIDDRLYFNHILNEATLVDDKLFGAIKSYVERNTSANITSLDYDFPIKNSNKDFLISALPLCESVSQLIDIYCNPKHHSRVDVECMLHDIALYNIPLSVNREEFILLLKKEFFAHPFAKALIKHLTFKKRLFFGEVKQWIQDNCTNVPTPRRWVLTRNVQVLFSWIYELGDGKYSRNRPNYSESLVCE